MVETAGIGLGGKAKKTFDTATKVVLGFLALLAIAIIFIISSLAINNLEKVNLDQVGATATQTPIFQTGDGGLVEDIITVVLGEGASVNWESLILYLAIFAILFFALSDIVSLFSTFSETTSWVIGFGLAIIAGVTGAVRGIAGIFAVTAVFGAVGIAIMIIAAIGAAVILNTFIGGPLKRWQSARQTQIDQFKAARGFAKVGSFVEGAKQITDKAGKGEKDR